MQHVAVGDDIVLAFEAEFARFPRARLAVRSDIIVEGNRLGADEALLEIRVDHACRLRRLGALRDRPGSRFLRADGEIGDEMQQRRSRRG